ncbi:MAG: hypothetical protein WBP56_20930 [Polyangia bacterium]
MRDFDPYCTDREHDWDQAMSHNDVDHDRGELQDENPESPVVMRAWAQRLLLQGSSQPPIQLPDGEEHVGTSLYNAVARIRRSAPALEAEAELRRILVIEMVRLRRERADSDFWAAARELASETMTCYRLLGRPVLTMGKFSDMRKAAWERWVEAVYERGVDPDQNPDPDDERPLDDQTFERLLSTTENASSDGSGWLTPSRFTEGLNRLLLLDIPKGCVLLCFYFLVFRP